jgi:hypothetical protein
VHSLQSTEIFTNQETAESENRKTIFSLQSYGISAGYSSFAKIWVNRVQNSGRSPEIENYVKKQLETCMFFTGLFFYPDVCNKILRFL